MHTLPALAAGLALLACGVLLGRAVYRPRYVTLVTDGHRIPLAIFTTRERAQHYRTATWDAVPEVARPRMDLPKLWNVEVLG